VWPFASFAQAIAQKMFKTWIDTALSWLHLANTLKGVALTGSSLPRPHPCRARPSQRLGLFALSKGAQAPLEPQRSPLPGTPITALVSAFNCRF
jgi:hypothetical protein